MDEENRCLYLKKIPYGSSSTYNENYPYKDHEVCEINCDDAVKLFNSQTKSRVKLRRKNTNKDKIKEESMNYNRTPVQSNRVAREKPGINKEKFKEELKKSLETPVKSDKAMKIMVNMGWDGGSLGTRGGGIIEPIKPDLDLKAGVGLGHIKQISKQTKSKTKAQIKHKFMIYLLKKLLEFLKSEESRIEVPCSRCVMKNEKGFVRNLMNMIKARKRVVVSDEGRGLLLDQIYEESIKTTFLQLDWSITDKRLLTFVKTTDSNSKNKGNETPEVKSVINSSPSLPLPSNLEIGTKRINASILNFIDRRYVTPFAPFDVNPRHLNFLIFRTTMLIYLLEFIKSDRKRVEMKFEKILNVKERGFVKELVRVANKRHNKNGSRTKVEKYLFLCIRVHGINCKLVLEFGISNISFTLEKLLKFTSPKKATVNTPERAIDSANLDEIDDLTQIYINLDKEFAPLTLPKDISVNSAEKVDRSLNNEVVEGIQSITVTISNSNAKKNKIDLKNDIKDTARTLNGSITNKDVPNATPDVPIVNTNSKNDSIDDEISVLELSDDISLFGDESDLEGIINNDDCDTVVLSKISTNLDGTEKFYREDNKIYAKDDTNLEIIEDLHPKRCRSDSENSDLKTSKKYKSSDTVLNAYLSPKNETKVKITVKFVQSVQIMISEKLDMTKELPLLKCHGIKDNSLLYGCHNQKSFLWLQKLCTARGINIFVKKEALIENTKMSLKINSFIEESYKKIFERLDLCNEGLSTSQWIWLKEEKFIDSLVITFEIDDFSYDYIKNANFRLFAGMDQAQFSVVWN